MSSVADAFAVLRAWLGEARPEAALVLGSGLGGLAARLEDARRLDYAAIPGFARPDVPGHAGELLLGRLGGRAVLCQAGRFHAYEGHAPGTVGLPVRAFAGLGIRTLLLTNAAGGIRRGFRPPTLMLLADHVNLSFRSPLAGRVLEGEERFPDMSAPYDADLRALAHRVARTAGLRLEDGVYAGLMGPSYETPAEIRMLERLGADAVGMSTVQEVMAARARGMRCLGLSVITNAAAGTTGERLSHEEVMAAGRTAGAAVEAIITGVVAAL